MSQDQNAHPWGESHSEKHESADPLDYLDRPIENVSEEKKEAAVQAVRDEIAKGSTLRRILGVVGDIVGIVK